jgi:hypothetical protein
MQVRSSSARPEFQDLYDQQTQMLEGLLTEGIRNGELRCLDIPKTARLVFELTRAAIAQHALGWSHEPIDQTTDLLCDLIWRGIGCSADSAPRS